MTAAIADPVGALVPHTPREAIEGSGNGPLAGLRFVVKDLYAIAGRKVSNGNPDWYESAEVAGRNAPSVQRLLDAGGTCIGVAVCDEFFYSLLGTNAHYGSPINPAAPARVTGGSSCGSAAAVAGGMCEFALGSDTGGSVRVPAAFCGLYGLRPTHGRIDAADATAMAPSYDAVGHFAADADIFRSVGRVLLDDAGHERPIERLLLAEDLFKLADDDIREALRPALAQIAPELPAGEQVTVVDGDIDEWRNAFRVIQASEIQQTLLPFITTHTVSLGPGIRERFEMAGAVSADELKAARGVRAAVSARLHDLANPGTVIMLPATPTVPPTVGPDGQPIHEEFRRRTMQFTCIAGHAGLPQISLPAGRTGDCPVGLSFIGWKGGDEALLDLAVRLAPHLDAKGRQAYPR